MSFEARNSTVGRLFTNAIYCMPRNQRHYVWTKQNWDDIYNDIQVVATKDVEPLFIGSIVLIDDGDIHGLSRYTVIDGQQRIITLTLFLCAILYTFRSKELLNDFEGTLKYITSRDTTNHQESIVYPEHSPSFQKIISSIVSLPRSGAEMYSFIVFSKLCTISRKDKNAISCFNFFAEKLSKLQKCELVAIRDSIIKIGYVNVVANSDEDAYTIFETLNARGLDLQDHELLKNYIMRYMQPQDKRDEGAR